MGQLIQQGSFDPAKGMDSYKPYRYAVPNLKTEYHDNYQMRTKISYERAAIVDAPEEMLAAIRGMMSNPSALDIDPADLERASADVKEGPYVRFLRGFPGATLTYNEKCPSSREASNFFDLNILLKLLSNLEDVLGKRGTSLKEVSIIIEEPFFGVDYRNTPYGQENKNKGFMRDDYPNHHTINRIKVIPRVKNGDVIWFYHNRVNPLSVRTTNGGNGIMVNVDLAKHGANVRKKKTVKEPANEYHILEEIRKLGGTKKIQDGNYSKKKSELMRLVNTLEIKDLALNDTGGEDALLSDLGVALEVLEDVKSRGWFDKVHVDFFEDREGTKGRHLINAALAYDKRGVKGVKERCVQQMSPIGTCNN